MSFLLQHRVLKAAKLILLSGLLTFRASVHSHFCILLMKC